MRKNQLMNRKDTASNRNTTTTTTVFGTRDPHEVASMINRMWLLGLSMVIFGSLGDFAALGLAAQSIVAPVSDLSHLSDLSLLLFFFFYMSTRS
jgi:hypothetical protein